jgi:hypothetical protein
MTTEILTVVVPVRRYDVRRRRHGADRWLIARNEYFRVDETADFVWRMCDGERSIGDVALALSRARELALDSALAATIMTLEYFRGRGLVAYAEPKTTAPSRE